VPHGLLIPDELAISPRLVERMVEEGRIVFALLWYSFDKILNPRLREE